MKAIFHPVDDTGCGYYRVTHPREAAEREGWEVEERDSIRLERNAQTGDSWVQDVDADVIIIQRPMKIRFPKRIEEYQARGVAVVVEIDDDLGALHPAHISKDLLEGKKNPGIAAKFLNECCAVADLVTVTSDALAEVYGGHGRVAVLPNCVPESLLSLPRLSDGHTIGWTGAAMYHPGDLEVTHGGIQLALEDTDWRYMKIGGGAEMSQKGLGLIQTPEQTGPLPIEGYHRAIGALDIGIVPLHDGRFNRAKSYLKGIEYAARGVVFISSATPEYLKLAEMGIGITVKDKSRSWKSALRAYMDNEELRHADARRQKDLVREGHTYETQGWRWAEAWEQAITNRKEADARLAGRRKDRGPRNAAVA